MGESARQTARRWPFVGRADQLVEVRRARRASTGTAGVVLVGPAGAGTTRLARAAVDDAAADGAAARWVMATRSATGIPLGAMAQLLPAGGPADVPRPQLLPYAASQLIESAGGHRLAIGINDAHLLDAVSASLVHHLAVTRAAFLILTARTDAAVPDPVFALWKEGLVERIDVGEFDREQTEDLVCEAVGGQVDGATLQELWELSRGNAMFLRELVETGLDRGVLSPVRGVWRWSGPIAPTRRLTDLIGARIGALRPDEQAALEMLAFGGPLDGDALLRAVDTEVLAGLEDRGLLVSRPLGQRVEVRIAHPLHAEVLRRRTSALRRRAVHRRLVETFEAAELPATDRGRAMAWSLEGGLPTDAARLLAAAEQQMAAGSDRGVAARLARAAVDQGGGFAAAFLLGQALIDQDRADEAETVLAGLEAVAGTDERRARLALTRFGNLYWAAGRPAAAAEVVRATGSEPGADPLRPERATARAALLLHDGRTAAALAVVTPLLEQADDSGLATVPAHAVAVDALCGCGRHDRAVALAERGLAMAHRARAPVPRWALTQLEAGCCAAHTFAGRFDDAERLARTAYREALAAHRPVGQSVHAGRLGMIALLRGRVRTAARWLRDATGAAPGGSFPPLPLLHAATALACAFRGDAAAARAAVEEARCAGGGAAAEAWVGIASAWAAAAGGWLAEAAESAEAAAAAARERGQAPCELEALHACVRFGAPDRVLERIEAVTAEVDGRLAAAYAAHARALAGTDAADLEAAAERFAALGAMLLAAETAAQAVQRCVNAGRPGAATMSATRARAWAEACEDARTPPLGLLHTAAELTPREREIAVLAASGLTSKAIAEGLVVSVRTVDNILHGVYQKLGVAGRRDLAAVVGVYRGPDAGRGE